MKPNTVLEQVDQSRNATGPVAEAMKAAAGRITHNPKGDKQ